MNDQESSPEGEGYKDSVEKGEDEAKAAVKEMFDGLRRLMDDMGGVADKMKSAQARHANVLANLGKHPMETARSEIFPLLEATLDLTSTMCDAQVLAMEMGQRQLKLSLDQMEKMIEIDL